jgi:tetratricopeptide (TPR) repeat protein
MWKAPKAKKLDSKFWNRHLTLFFLLFIFFSISISLYTDDSHEKTTKEKNESSDHDNKKEKNHNNPVEVKHTPATDNSHDVNTKKNTHGHDNGDHSEKVEETDPAELVERLKTAHYDYDEKLYGQALENYIKILSEYPHNISNDEKKSIQIKMAHCHFELGQYYKAILLLDPIIGIDKLPLDFQYNNFHSTLINYQTLIQSLKKPSYNGMKPITVLFPELNKLDDVKLDKIVETFNSILNSPYSCKKLTSTYKSNNSWKNPLINQIPINGTDQEIKLLTRLILEELYPINSYLNNEKTKQEIRKDEHGHEISFIKNQYFYEALYWRSRIHMKTYYYSFARSGFEEVSASLNYKENEKIISCLFFKAKATFFLGQYKLALKDFDNLNALYSIDEFYKNNFNEETVFYIARSYFELAKFDKAIQKFLLLTAGYENREPHSKLIRNAYYWLGESYYCKGLLNEAIKSYQVILNFGTYAEKENVHYSMGWALFEKGDLASKDAAKKQFDLLLTNYPNTEYRLKTELKLAEIEIEEGNSDRGEKIINELKNSTMNDNFIIKNNNILKQTDYLIGLLYIKKNEYKKALIHFKRSEDTLDPNLKQKINIQYGICYRELGDFKKAITYFTLASEMEINENLQVSAKENLADTYIKRKSNQSDLESASKIYDSIISQQPNHIHNVDWRKKKSEILRQQKRDDEAIATLNKILVEDKVNWEFAQLEIGNILMAASPQRFKVAAAHYKTIIDKITNKDKNEEALLNYAICLLKSNQGVDAIRYLQRLIKESTNTNTVTDAYQYLALCYEKENDVKTSISILNNSLTKYPQQKNRIHLHQECVRLYQSIQDIDSAKKHLNALYLEVTEPNSQAEALYQLAAFDLKSNEGKSLENAIDKFKIILQKYNHTKSGPNASFQLGKIYIAKKDIAEAKKYLDQITNANQEPELIFSSLTTLGDFYYQENKFKEALEYYLKATFPESTGDFKKNEVIKESILSKKADCYFQLKDYKPAKDEYMILIRMNRDNLEYKIRYAKCCLESKSKLSDAISILEKIPSQSITQETEKLLEQLKSIQLKENNNN